MSAVYDGQALLDRELAVLQRLHDRGCGERVVCPLAQTRWEGCWLDDPEERRLYHFQVTGAGWLDSDVSSVGRGHQGFYNSGAGAGDRRRSTLQCMPHPLFAAAGSNQAATHHTPCLQPTYAYLMPAYRLGSVRSLLDDICNQCGCGRGLGCRSAVGRHRWGVGLHHRLREGSSG